MDYSETHTQALMDDSTLPYVENNLYHYLEITTDWAFALAKDLSIINCYKNTDLDYGTHPAELIGKNFITLLPREYQNKVSGLLENARLQKSGKFLITYLNNESDYIELSGISVWQGSEFREYKILIRNHTKRVNRGWIRTSFSDELSQLERPEKDLDSYWKKQAKQYELLAAVSLAFSGNASFDETINQVLKMIGQHLDADRCVIAGIDYEKKLQGCLYEWHSPHTHSAIATKQNEEFIENNEFYRLLTTSPYVGVSDTSKMNEKMLSQFIIEDEKAFIHFPIFVNDLLFGSFGIDFCREKHDWEASEISMFQTIVNCLATSIKRNRAEEQVLEAHSLLEDIIHNYPGIIWYCDTNYKCRLMNGGGMNLLGFTPEMFLGKNMLEVSKKYASPAMADMIAQTFSDGPQRLNFEKNSRYLALSTSLMHNSKNQITGLVGVCLDITDVQQMQKKLQLAIDEARQANHAKSEFLSRMSHEIRTPMNAIVGMNTIAQKAENPEKINYCLEKIRVASDQLLTLINDILDMSKIEANKFELAEAEFVFDLMLQKVCNVIDVKIAEKQQNFLIDFTEVFSKNVVADELRLSQVLINLLSNAVKFTPKGNTITLKIRSEEIDPSFSRFRFEIIDTGIGISAENQKKLFASFEQGDGGITRKYGGTGLGLAISQSIIHLMGGEIKLESEVGKGSNFSFTVDLKWGNEIGNKDSVSKLLIRDTRILVIDDSEDVREYFENILESFSMACHTAPDGIRGIEMVEEAIQQKEPYDLIFVDWLMPGIDGIETARIIKNIVSKDTIVIMISVADWSDIEKEAMAIGVNKFLAKPTIPSVLFNSIIEWMNISAVDQVAVEETVKWDVNWNGKCMLLAEDIDINQEIIISMLSETGIQIDCVKTGIEALTKYRQAGNGYDVILMDIQMPEMDGLEATRQIRGLGTPEALGIPIIAMTANAFQSDIDQCLKAGMHDHVAKPVSMDDLIQKISKYLK